MNPRIVELSKIALMKPLACLLIALTLWSQFDDTLLATELSSPSAPLASGDDDEFLPARRRESEEHVAVRRPAEPIRAKRPASGTRSARSSRPVAHPITTAFAPPPLYLLMSLQI